MDPGRVYAIMPPFHISVFPVNAASIGVLLPWLYEINPAAAEYPNTDIMEHTKVFSVAGNNPADSSLAPSDTCYVLSFAIIMLNTSLHNPNVRDKPPVERFISMNRGINEGGDLPEELLRVRIGLC